MNQTLPTPIDGSCRAKYADGYVHDETALHDVGREKNVFHDILERYPEAEHGKMVTFSVFFQDKQYDFDFSRLPDNARPIRFKHMEAEMVQGEPINAQVVRMDIGYQFTDEAGNHQEVIRL